MHGARAHTYPHDVVLYIVAVRRGRRRRAHRIPPRIKPDHPLRPAARARTCTVIPYTYTYTPTARILKSRRTRTCVRADCVLERDGEGERRTRNPTHRLHEHAPERIPRVHCIIRHEDRVQQQQQQQHASRSRRRRDGRCAAASGSLIKTRPESFSLLLWSWRRRYVVSVAAVILTNVTLPCGI